MLCQHGVSALQGVTEIDEEHGRDAADNHALADASAPAVLHISILRAKDLIAADSGGTSDPYVRIHVGR